MADGSIKILNQIATVFIKIKEKGQKPFTFQEECLVMPMAETTSNQLLLCAESASKYGFLKILKRPELVKGDIDEIEALPESYSALDEVGRIKNEKLLEEYHKGVGPEGFARVEPVSFELRDKEKGFTADHRHPSLKNTEIITNQVKEWLDKGKIRPSTSEYSSAVTVAPKPDAPGRVCIDARTLNEYIKGNENPIPRLDDLFACKQFIGAKYFAKLDLKSAYTQIPLEEKCKHLSAFKTP
ncbi:hypothetical protein ADUPG1_005608, partial [Aduncisulcus paluster]